MEWDPIFFNWRNKTLEKEKEEEEEETKMLHREGGGRGKIPVTR